MKKLSPDFETSPTTYETLNFESLEPCENKPQRHQRPYDNRLEQLDGKMSDQQKASYFEPVNEAGYSPHYENGILQNYETLHFDVEKSSTDYETLHHLHDTNHAQVTSVFQRSTLYEPSRSDSAPGRSGNKISSDSPLYQNV